MGALSGQPVSWPRRRHPASTGPGTGAAGAAANGAAAGGSANGAAAGGGGVTGPGATVGRPGDRDGQRFYRGVAAVPQLPRSDDDTGELPVVPAVPVAGRHPTVPRQGWRSLRRGGGWTMAGLWIAVVCWGIWAVSLRNGDLVTATFALGFLLGTAVLVFTVSRLLGRMVLEGMLGRPRPGAVPSHLLVFGLLVIGAGAFLQQTWWLVAAWNWVAGALL